MHADAIYIHKEKSLSSEAFKAIPRVKILENKYYSPASLISSTMIKKVTSTMDSTDFINHKVYLNF